jgi:hypothetical protein
MSSGRTASGSRQNKKPRNDERKKKKDCGKIKSVIVAQGTEASDNRYEEE